MLRSSKEFSCEFIYFFSLKLFLAIFSDDKSVECWMMIDIEICESFSWKNNGSFKDLIARWIFSSNEHHQLTVWCINYKLNYLEILMEFCGVIRKNCRSTLDDCHGMKKEDIAEMQQCFVLQFFLTSWWWAKRFLLKIQFTSGNFDENSFINSQLFDSSFRNWNLK